MTRHRFCTVEELAERDRLLREINGREIAVFNVDGEFLAVANHCVHAGGPVCEGRIAGEVTGTAGEWERGWDRDGEILACPWHGWEFDLISGKFLSDPKYKLVTYDVEIDGGTIYVVT